MLLSPELIPLCAKEMQLSEHPGLWSTEPRGMPRSYAMETDPHPPSESHLNPLPSACPTLADPPVAILLWLSFFHRLKTKHSKCELLDQH